MLSQGIINSFPCLSVVPENSAGIIPKTIEVTLYKEGNSFGFVLRGQCLFTKDGKTIFLGQILEINKVQTYSKLQGWLAYYLYQ